jgi:hypothetical protein
MVSLSEKMISIRCKVKYNLWGEDITLEELPTSFLELIKLFSKLFFPNNFSINYIHTNYDLQPVDGAQTYRELISVINKSDMKEIKLLVNIFKDDTKCKKTKRKLSEKPRMCNSMVVINELSEHSCNISDEASGSSRSNKGDHLCLIKEKNGKNEKLDVRNHSCISCY